MSIYITDVFDLKVFDVNGTLITHMNKAIDSELINDDNGSYLLMNIPNFDLEFIKSMGKVEDDSMLSDFDKIAKPKNTIIKFKDFSNSNSPTYKLIAEGTMCIGAETEKESFKIVVHEAKLVSGLNLSASIGTMSNFSHGFKLLPNPITNETFELHL